MLGGSKQAKLSELGFLKPAKLKIGHAQHRTYEQIEKGKEVGNDDELLPDVKQTIQCESDPAADKADPSSNRDDNRIQKLLGSLQSSEPAAAPQLVVAKAAGVERARPCSRVGTEQAAGIAQRKSQQAQPVRVVQGPQSSCVGVTQGRTGEDIWQLNMQLGKIAQQLGDQEDGKPNRRRHKSPTLTENLTKRWGGNYGHMLDKSFMQEEEELPEPKYEPPLFLENEEPNDDGPRISEKDVAAELVSRSSPSSKLPAGPAPTPAPGRRGTATAATKPGAGRRGAAAGAKPASAGLASAAAGASGASASAMGPKGKSGPVMELPTAIDIGPADAGNIQDTVVDVDGSDDELDAQPSGRSKQSEDDTQPAPRRGGRRPRVALAETAPKQAQARAAPGRRIARGAGLAAASKIIAATALDALEDGPGLSDLMDVLPSVMAPAPVLPGSTNPSRTKKTHPPTTTAFRSTVVKQPGSLAAVVGSGMGADCMEDFTMNSASCDVATGTVKRAREAMSAAEDKQRQSKASRLELQQAKDNEALRSKVAELESKNRQLVDQIKELKDERVAAERRATSVEMERKREASELVAAQREIEKLKAELKDREEKMAAFKALEGTVKQLKDIGEVAEKYSKAFKILRG